MVYRVLADCVVLVHAAFVAFVVLGGFLAWRWRAVVLLHVPCALWGIAIEYGGWVCPPTPPQNLLGGRAGVEGHRRGVVRHYRITALYPPGPARPPPAVLGTPVLGVKLLAYGGLLDRRRPSLGGPEIVRRIGPAAPPPRPNQDDAPFSNRRWDPAPTPRGRPAPRESRDPHPPGCAHRSRRPGPSTGQGESDRSRVCPPRSARARRGGSPVFGGGEIVRGVVVTRSG